MKTSTVPGQSLAIPAHLISTPFPITQSALHLLRDCLNRAPRRRVITSTRPCAVAIRSHWNWPSVTTAISAVAARPMPVPTRGRIIRASRRRKPTRMWKWHRRPTTVIEKSIWASNPIPTTPDHPVIWTKTRSHLRQSTTTVLKVANQSNHTQVL
jgi:hypothetical protein